MRINGKVKGDMTGHAIKYNDSNGTRLVVIKIALVCDQDRTEALFGKEFSSAAFGSLVLFGGDEETPATIHFGYRSLSPAAICEVHEVKILGAVQNIQPTIKRVIPVKDRAEVIVEIEMPILIGDNKELAGSLGVSFGEVIDVEFDPAQIELDLGGNGKTPGMTIKKGAFGNPDPVQTSV